MAQSNMTKMKLPNAMFDLNLSSGSQVSSVISSFLSFVFQVHFMVFLSLQDNTEQVHLEFTHDELYAFYNQVCGFC